MTLTTLVCAAALGAGVVAATAEASLASTTASPELALAIVGGASEPQLFLAQRQIERSWGRSEDSVYREIEIPGWRSEGAAAGLSAAVPGAGQAYTGSRRAWIYALAEVAGWTSRWFYERRGHDLQDEASAYAGSPSDTTSRWSFERWESRTSGNASTLRALYERDRKVFYDEIARDPNLLAGWAGVPATTRTPFSNLRRNADDRLRFARYSGTSVWINHIVSAVDALRAARLHNVPLGRSTRLGLKGSWHHGSPAFTAALRRSF